MISSIVTPCFFADPLPPVLPSFAVTFFARPLSPFVPQRPFALSFAASLAAQPRSLPSFLPASHALIVLVKRKSPMDERTRGRWRPRRRPWLSRPSERKSATNNSSIKFQHPSIPSSPLLSSESPLLRFMVEAIARVLNAGKMIIAAFLFWLIS